MRILLIDDEELFRYSLSKQFRQDGAEVTAVMSGTEAIEKLGQDSFDVCFLDVQLPDANGLELMHVIHDLSPATRIVVMTAKELTNAQLWSIRDRGAVYLPKPFDLTDAQSIVTGHRPGKTVADP